MGFDLVFKGFKHVPTTLPVPSTIHNLLNHPSFEAEDRQRFQNGMSTNRKEISEYIYRDTQYLPVNTT